jgi:hypothetical protein
MSSYYTYSGNLGDRNKFTSTVDRKTIKDSLVTKRYFSQLDTEIYFGAEHVDEIVAFDFTVSEPKLPIYGFNSFYANRIVSGRRTIQGTFAINFNSSKDKEGVDIIPGTYYLLNILEKIDDSILKAKYETGDLTLDYESLLFRCEGEDSTGLGIGNNALFSKIFDITLSYGYGKTEGMQTYGSCYQTLVGVQIVDYRQALDTEGNPILDMYSFIAKDIRYIDAVSDGGSDESSSPSEPETKVCTKCNQSPCICSNKDIEPVKASRYVKEELNDVTAKCKDGVTPGYIIDATFNYSKAGSVAGSAYPYILLKLSGLNDQSKEYTDVSMSVYDHKNGINTTLEFDNIKKDGQDIFEFKDSYRDLGISLRNLYMEDEDYVAQCVLDFYATINGKMTKIHHSFSIHRNVLNI